MELIFLRHGEAQSFAPKDNERKLTTNGRLSIENLANSLKNRSESFDFIFSSPVIRAHETALIISDILNINDKLILDNRLSCGAGFSEIRDILNENKSINSALFVGHAPDLEIIAQELLGLTEQPNFKTGGCMKLSCSFLRPRTAKLIYFLN